MSKQHLPPLPEHLAHECTACGRKFVSSNSHKQYDTTGYTGGYVALGLCTRDRYRVHRHGAPVTVLHRAEDVAGEVQQLVDYGSTLERAVEDVARDMGMQVASVHRALKRAQARGVDVAA